MSLCHNDFRRFLGGPVASLDPSRVWDSARADSDCNDDGSLAALCFFGARSVRQGTLGNESAGASRPPRSSTLSESTCRRPLRVTALTRAESRATSAASASPA